MKRMLLIAVTCAVAISVAGCGQTGSAVSGFTWDDLALTVNQAEYRVNMDIEDVIAELGDGFQYAEGMSCDYDGLDKTYTYGIATFYTNPLAAGDMISEIYTEDRAVTTTRGIAVGATRKDVEAAYGADYEDWEDLMIYRLAEDRVSLCFEIEDGVVWAIYLTNQSV